MSFTRLDLLAYVLPALAAVLVIRWWKKRAILEYSHLATLLTVFERAGRLRRLPSILLWLGLGFLILAVFNPVLTFSEQEILYRGIDIVLVVDLSSSMQQALPADEEAARELQRIDSFFATRGAGPSRLDAVKNAVTEFIRRRSSDRIGLVVFSSNAYVVSPMTLDYDYLTGYVNMMEHRTLVGEGLTAIGEGIFTAVNLAEKQNESRPESDGDQLLVVLTDGENNYGRSPIAAIEYARERDFKMYLIGVEVPMSTLTTRIVSAIRKAGGAYFDVRNQEQLDRAYWEIGALEKGAFAVKEYQRSVPFYHQTVLLSLVCVSLAVALQGFSFFADLA